MKLFVLDASAWIRLYLADGPMPRGLDEAAVDVDQGRAVFVAPELILVESAHALSRKRGRSALSASERDALWRDMRRMPLELMQAEDHIDRAITLAEQHRLSVYDALYVAVAVYLGAPLWTADIRLAAAASKLGLGGAVT